MHHDVVAGYVVFSLAECLCVGSCHGAGHAGMEHIAQASIGPLFTCPLAAQLVLLIECIVWEVQDADMGYFVGEHILCEM